MPHADGCGCSGGTPDVPIPEQPKQVSADEGDTSPGTEGEVSFTKEELKVITGYLYYEVPHMKGYLNNELKHFVRGEHLQIPLPRVCGQIVLFYQAI